jgi:hypothetical protein
MALVINDRVKETTTTTGTGTVSLGGAVTGFETFAAGIGNSNTVYYCIAHQDQAEFEVGLGTLDGDSSDLARTTIISSSNSDSAVDFSAGTKDVFCTVPASKMVFEDANDSVASVTSLKNTSLVIGRDADNDIDFATDNNIIFRASGADQIVLKDGVLEPVTDDDVALGTSGTKRFTNLFLSGAVTAGGAANIGGNLSLNGVFEIDVASGDPTIILDTQGADKFHIAVDDSDSDNFVIKSGSTVGGGNGLKLDSTGNLTVTADLSVGDDLTVEGGVVDVKNTGSQSQVRFYCESSNAHYAAIQAPAHADFSGNTTLTLPAVTDTIAGIAATQTLTNKTLTTPKIAEIDSLSSGNITLDAEADIILDADGADVIFKDAGTTILTFTNSSSDAVITAGVQDKDIIFKGDDNGSAITALTLDMSEAGAATFNDKITAVGTSVFTNLDISGDVDVDGTLETDALSIASTTVTSTAAELNILDGVTSTATELNILDGVTSTTAELNILDGVTSTAAELNYSDLATLGTSAASKVLSANANNLTTISGAVLCTEDTLTDQATIAWDVIASPVAKVTLGANRTIAAPSGTSPAAGQFVALTVIQDGTGSRTLTWNATYEFKDDTAPTLTTTASKGDLFIFKYNGSKWLEVGRNQNLTLS